MEVWLAISFVWSELVESRERFHDLKLIKNVYHWIEKSIRLNNLQDVKNK